MKCSNCPVGLGQPCVGETLKFKSFCEMAKSDDPIKIQHIINRSKMPTIIEQSGNLVRAATRIVKQGLKFVSEEKKQARLTVCYNCENYVNNRCKLCGCNLAAKASLETEQCPLRLWPGDQPTS